MSNKLMLSVALFGLSANLAVAQQTEVLPSDAVPRLNIVWDCGSCQPNEKVPPLVEQAFQAEVGNPFRMNYLCESVGKEAYEKLAAALVRAPS